MQKKEEKEKAKARNEEIGTNERAVAHPPISAAQVLLTSPVHTTPPAPLMHCTKMGLSPERSYVRLASVNGLPDVRGSLPADWTDRHHCTRTDLFSVLPLALPSLLRVSMISISPSIPYPTSSAHPWRQTSQQLQLTSRATCCHRNHSTGPNTRSKLKRTKISNTLNWKC